MSTKSTIAIADVPNNDYRGIYCHWDGDVSHNGKILFESYKDREKVEELLNLGALSILGKEIGEKQSFESPKKGFCLSYGRDRGEKDVDAVQYDSIEDLVKDSEKYLYVYRRNTEQEPFSWFVLDRKYSNEFQLVEYALKPE